MIDKQEFYHGAALLRVIRDDRLVSVRRHQSGYLINGHSFLLIKFSTRPTSPWRFIFTAAESMLLTSEALEHYVFVAFVCGGDGICAVPWSLLQNVFDERRPWVCCARRFHERYAVSGALGDFTHRVSHNQWPAVLFSVNKE